MTTRLFHAIIVCGGALSALPLACSSEPLGNESPKNHANTPADAGVTDENLENRCKLPDGTCVEHCSPIADGGCLDPCFVHTVTCSPDCLGLDGSCGWPPTK